MPVISFRWRLLIESGADVNGVDPRKNTPLHETSNGAGVRGLIPLLVNAGAHVNARNWRRVTPLHNACRRGSLPNARALLSRGAHIDALDTNRESPIFRCVGDRREGLGDSDMLAVVKFLVAQGADLTIRNRKGIGLVPRSAYGGLRQLSNWRGERDERVGMRTHRPHGRYCCIAPLRWSMAGSWLHVCP